jgi:hypothetical protein
MRKRPAVPCREPGRLERRDKEMSVDDDERHVATMIPSRTKRGLSSLMAM